jgi:hypothetical protein
MNAEIPYGIPNRPLPEGTSLDRLLPPRVGNFVRDPIKPPGKGMPIYADYRRGPTGIFMELGICDDARDAYSAVQTAAGETGIEDQIVESAGISCLHMVNADGAFIAWTRGRYYFSAHAKGGAKDLDEFMAAFPY